MATWIVTTGRKDLTEVEEWTKDDIVIKRMEGWRSGTWYVTTSDDNEPQVEADPMGMVDMNWLEGSNIEECEFESTNDGVWGEWEFPEDFDEDEQQRIIDGFEEDFYDFMEEDGWSNSDTYYYAHADSLEFEREDV